MTNHTETILGEAILWAARLVGLLLLYLLLRHFKPNLFYKGWGSLRPDYSIADSALPASLAMHHTSLRVGSEHYNQTAHLGLDAAGVYLQRPLASKEDGKLFIPYQHLTLVPPPGRTGALGLPVYGVFKVNGVDIWIDSPYAEQIIKSLPAP